MMTVPPLSNPQLSTVGDSPPSHKLVPWLFGWLVNHWWNWLVSWSIMKLIGWLIKGKIGLLVMVNLVGQWSVVKLVGWLEDEDADDSLTIENQDNVNTRRTWQDWHPDIMRGLIANSYLSALYSKTPYFECDTIIHVIILSSFSLLSKRTQGKMYYHNYHKGMCQRILWGWGYVEGRWNYHQIPNIWQLAGKQKQADVLS